MKINEYVAMSNAFEKAFPFMINRLIDAGIVTGEFPTHDKIVEAEDACWNELCISFEAAGLSFDRIPE